MIILLELVVEGEGFEPPKAEPADLQSAPVDRLGTPPKNLLCGTALQSVNISSGYAHHVKIECLSAWIT